MPAKSHGKTRSPEYRTWCGMIARCHNTKRENYPRYGGRGIRVCDEWRGPGGFERFLAHVGARPSPDHSIDRYPDRSGNYEPGNVRWATDTQQTMNRDAACVLTYGGQTKLMKEWAAEFGVSYFTAYNRFARNGIDPVLSLELPPSAYPMPIGAFRPWVPPKAPKPPRLPKPKMSKVRSTVCRTEPQAPARHMATPMPIKAIKPPKPPKPPKLPKKPAEPKPPRTRPTLSDRFWRYVNKNGPTVRPDLGPCWTWTGPSGRLGLGGRAGRIETAPRIAFFLEHGRWPQPMCIRACDNQSCVRHVVEATAADRTHARDARGPRRTHCPRGHEYSAENTRWQRNGTRRPGSMAKICITCDRARGRRRSAAKSAARASLATSHGSERSPLA